MSELSLQRPTQPELLSEQELCEILKNSCIEIKNFEKLSKTELVEIYKRIAMPLPQRQHGHEKYKVKNKHNVNGILESVEHDQDKTLQNSNSCESDNASSINLCEKRRRISQTDSAELLKSSADETTCASKKIRLSTTSKTEMDCNGIEKHKMNDKIEDSTVSPTKKRQKITWP